MRQVDAIEVVCAVQMRRQRCGALWATVDEQSTGALVQKAALTQVEVRRIPDTQEKDAGHALGFQREPHRSAQDGRPLRGSNELQLLKCLLDASTKALPLHDGSHGLHGRMPTHALDS